MRALKKGSLLTAFIFLILLGGASPGSASLSFLADTLQEIYSSGTTIPITQANMVLQTKDGYIWVACYDGLIRYDGKHSKIFDQDDGLPSRSIMSIFEANDGGLWIGTNNAGLARYDKREGFRVFSITDGLPSNSVRDFAESSNGTIYAATTLGLAAITPEGKVRTIQPPDFGPLVISDIFVSQKDELWCVLNEGDVLVLSGDKPIHHFSRHHFSDSVTRAAFQASDGAIYLGFSGSTVAVLGAGNAFKIYDTGPVSYINSFYEDLQGQVWACSDTGMGFFRMGSFHSVEGALLQTAIENMIVDFEGNLWFASGRKGLLQIIKSKFVNISKASHLPPIGANVTYKFNGDLYIGHDQGLVVLDKADQPQENSLTEYLAGIRVRDIIEDKDGNLWIATYSSHGIIRYSKEGKITSFNMRGHNLVSDTVRCALPLDDGRIIVGTAEGLSIIRGDRVERNYTRKDGLINPIIMNLFVDNNGCIYAGSDGGGIYVINEEGITNFTEADGLPSGIIMRMRDDPMGTGLWISTENGICIRDAFGFHVLDKLGKYGVNIFDIQFLIEDTVWLMGLSGIFIVKRQSLFSDGDLVVDTLHERDGLRDPLTANAWNYRTKNDHLYVCTNTGVLSIAMDSVYKNNIPPRLLLSRVTIDDQIYFHPEKIIVPAEANRVTVDFSLISYIYPTGNQVTYFLEGFDKEPVSVSTDYNTSISYTNLRAGNYIFRISGRNQEGVQSADITLPIVKIPRMWERPLFQAGAFLAFIGMGLLWGMAYNRYQTRAIRKREQEYRAITEQAITVIADTIDAKDHYTHGHSKRVGEYSRILAQRLKLPEKEQEDIYYAGLLHDIGKIGLEGKILNKEGRLTKEEFDKVKQHAALGGDILKGITIIQDIAVGARYHHERYDGQGYCQGLKAEEIPLIARIICVADAYDAMSTTRSYRQGQSKEYILEQLETGKGTQFDRNIATIMIDLIHERVVPIEV